MRAGPQINWLSTTEIVQVVYAIYLPCVVADEEPAGIMTIPYLGGSTVAFLPLQNVTSQYQSLITSTSVNPSSLFPPSTDPSIIAGYVAQTKLLQSVYSSSHTAVAEIAWEGGDTVPLAIIRPSSRGSININTTDPSAAPVIDFNTFSHPIDIAIAIASVKKIREWAASPPMQALGTLETFPGANVSSDAEIEEAIRNAATSSWQHPTSTTAMMKREWGGVVDAELRVYGTRGLRVVDAGVFPMSVAGHSSSSVYAVAEKVSLFLWVDARVRDEIADLLCRRLISSKRLGCRQCRMCLFSMHVCNHDFLRVRTAYSRFCQSLVSERNYQTSRI